MPRKMPPAISSPSVNALPSVYSTGSAAGTGLVICIVKFSKRGTRLPACKAAHGRITTAKINIYPGKPRPSPASARRFAHTENNSYLWIAFHRTINEKGIQNHFNGLHAADSIYRRRAATRQGHGFLSLDRGSPVPDRKRRSPLPQTTRRHRSPHIARPTQRLHTPHHRLLQPFEHRPYVRKENRLEHRPRPELLVGCRLRNRIPRSGALPDRPHGLRDRPVEHLGLRQLHDRKIRLAPLLGRQHLQPQQTTPELRRGLRLLSGCILRRGLQCRRRGLCTGTHHHDGHLPHLLLHGARRTLLHRRQRGHRLHRGEVQRHGHGRLYERHQGRRRGR